MKRCRTIPEIGSVTRRVIPTITFTVFLLAVCAVFCAVCLLFPELTGVVGGGGVVSDVEAGRLPGVIFPCTHQIEGVSAACVAAQLAPVGAGAGAEEDIRTGNEPDIGELFMIPL